MTLHIYGIRHHGPGSAKSLLKALENEPPEILLVEGPPEAKALLVHALDPQLKPPVAFLVYAKNNPSQCSFFPMASFSPEWVALRWALPRNIPVQFIDLPQSHGFALEPVEHTESDVVLDPIGHLGQLVGYPDGERFWEHCIELQHASHEIFEVVLEMMQTLRAQFGETEHLTLLREAHMRTCIRQAQTAYQRVAVVCGAWHAPELIDSRLKSTAKDDRILLKGLPKTPTEATWIPWTLDRLTLRSGYRAGIHAPGWYQHVWNTSPQDLVNHWLIQVAQVLRKRDIDISTAHIIEAVRLTDALTQLADRPIADLQDITDAAISTLGSGDVTLLKWIEEELTIGHALGEVPTGVPLSPLPKDFAAMCKRLRIQPSATDTTQVLDMRQPLDLERSVFFHRLRLLGIPWGEPQAVSQKGTFKEAWTLKWDPEYSIFLIEAERYGQTVVQASTHKANERAKNSKSLTETSSLLQDALLAQLPEVTSHILNSLQRLAAQSHDIVSLMQSLPHMAQALRYGNVRQTDVGLLKDTLMGFLIEICVGFSVALVGLGDDAAEEMIQAITTTNQALLTLQDKAYLTLWYTTLKQLDIPSVHGGIGGTVTRILHDTQHIDPLETETLFGLGLSNPTVQQAAFFAEAFVGDSGWILIHDHNLFAVLDRWLSHLTEAEFLSALPLLRRSFAMFSPAERRKLGEKAQCLPHLDGPASDAERALDASAHERMRRAIRQAERILSVAKETQDGP
ncbi:MAG: DUF5682 family protein [Deinococcaceae bacterium]